MSSVFDQPVISGQDIAAHMDLNSAVFPRALKEKGEGRFLTSEDEGKPNIVISRKIAADFPDAQGKPRKLGDSLRIADKKYTIIGIYETGSMLLDVVIVMDIDTARSVLNFAKDSISSIYVEATNPRAYDDALRGDREGQSRRRRPEHERGPGEFRVPHGTGGQAAHDDRQPGAPGGNRGDHQHHADEHDRAVRRVRRAQDQWLVGGQHPDPGDARERVSRA